MVIVHSRFLARAALALVLIIGCYLIFGPGFPLSPPPPRVKTETQKVPAPAPPPPPANPHHAYVFYATTNTYTCSALVNAHRLRNLFHTEQPIYFLVGPDVTHPAVAAIETSNLKIKVIHDVAPKAKEGSVAYYAQVLLKLRALRLHHVNPALKRVLVLDADQLIRKSLDHLFELPPVDVAAPAMYWGDGLSVTTALMVAMLSEPLWKIIDGALKNVRPDEYDMDIVNKVLQKRLMVLPGRYCTLNSHWEAADLPGWFKGIKTSGNATDAELVELYRQVEVLHFTAMGKPWKVAPERIVQDREYSGLSKVHPLFVEQFSEWHQDANKVCRGFWQFVEPPPPDSPPMEMPPPPPPAWEVGEPAVS